MGVLNSFASLLVLVSSLDISDSVRYKPTWESLDARPLPGVRSITKQIRPKKGSDCEFLMEGDQAYVL